MWVPSDSYPHSILKILNDTELVKFSRLRGLLPSSHGKPCVQWTAGPHWWGTSISRPFIWPSSTFLGVIIQRVWEWLIEIWHQFELLIYGQWQIQTGDTGACAPSKSMVIGTGRVGWIETKAKFGHSRFSVSPKTKLFQLKMLCWIGNLSLYLHDCYSPGTKRPKNFARCAHMTLQPQLSEDPTLFDALAFNVPLPKQCYVSAFVCGCPSICKRIIHGSVKQKSLKTSEVCSFISHIFSRERASPLPLPPIRTHPTVHGPLNFTIAVTENEQNGYLGYG